MHYTLLGFGVTLVLLFVVESFVAEGSVSWYEFAIGAAATPTFLAAFSEGAMLAVSVYLATKGIKKRWFQSTN